MHPELLSKDKWVELLHPSNALIKQTADQIFFGISYV